MGLTNIEFEIRNGELYSSDLNRFIENSEWGELGVTQKLVDTLVELKSKANKILNL